MRKIVMTNPVQSTRTMRKYNRL